eukprot:GHVN01097862.1.p1 GENE.GHVN01097862.1~~GHVN01097862.1.p1  ORF type:complete len:190 (+),score=11.82 GHVN01097862.1:2-571(+)
MENDLTWSVSSIAYFFLLMAILIGIFVFYNFFKKKKREKITREYVDTARFKDFKNKIDIMYMQKMAACKDPFLFEKYMKGVVDSFRKLEDKIPKAKRQCEYPSTSDTIPFGLIVANFFILEYKCSCLERLEFNTEAPDAQMISNTIRSYTFHFKKEINQLFDLIASLKYKYRLHFVYPSGGKWEEELFY